MCYVCDRGGTVDPAEVLDRFRFTIAQHGWAVTGVNTLREGLTHLYTVGLTLRGWPELFLGSRVDIDTGHDILNTVALKAQALARAPQVGDQVLVGGDRALQATLIEYHRLSQLNVMQALYGNKPLRVLRIRLADPALEPVRRGARS